MSLQKTLEQRTLEEIRDILSNLVGLFRLVNSSAIQDAKAGILKNEVRKKVYELCDGTRTVKAIAQTVDSERPLPSVQPLVSYHLAALESNGLIGHRDDKGQRFYFRTLE